MIIYNKKEYLLYIVFILLTIGCGDESLKKDNTYLNKTQNNSVNNKVVETEVLKQTAPNLEVTVSSHYKR